MMGITREITAVLRIEDCGLENRNDTSYDSPRKYVASSTNFAAEGEIYFTSRPSQLDETVNRLFRTNTIQRPYSSSSTHTSNLHTVTNSSDRRTRYFLTRDPIYAVPHGETRDLLMDVGKAVVGHHPGVGYELLCDIVDEIISPPKKIY